MSPEELSAFTLKCTCMVCHIRDHLASYHSDDGIIKDNLPLLPHAGIAPYGFAITRKTPHNQTRSHQQPQRSKEGSGKRVLFFTAALYVCTVANDNSRSTPGLVVNDGALCCAICLTELFFCLLVLLLTFMFHLNETNPFLLNMLHGNLEKVHIFPTKRRILG